MHKRLFVSRLARANFPLVVETAPVPSITEGFLEAEMARAKMHKRVHFVSARTSCRQACHHCHNRKQRRGETGVLFR